MGLFSKNETGKPCQACGHETTPEDPAVRTKNGNARIHKSHTTTPGNGFYGEKTKRFT
ncbi:hypothetical protein [Streptomyces antibioticus]|uniref:Uncharacterized protein n=1 Tax=Streptomyces antibioticus TaxID=1890 RepID=A0AAE7CNP3_STRAT|nr:hypothetical protein [Streptomyces antibioticus]QIT47614.1 hypothetical protein HCX60_32170 [Streptomyces antibioticus]